MAAGRRETTVVTMKDDIVSLSDYVWQRTSRRLDGLADAEYFSEPVPGCWTVRDRGDGHHFPDGVLPPPDPAPFTTVAWRLAHLTRAYGADRNGRFLRVPLEPAVLDAGGAAAPTADAAVGLLERAHGRWRSHLTAVPAAAMSERLGPIAGPFADGTLTGFVLHMVDEFVHHGAELALLRDLYRATSAGSAVSSGDELVDAAIRDPTTLDTLRRDTAALAEAVRSHPAAVAEAASVGRWDIVTSLADLGFELDRPGGRTALHLAAGAGPLHAVAALVERGADTGATEPVHGATPLGWAQYLDNREVADYLAPRTPGG